MNETYARTWWPRLMRYTHVANLHYLTSMHAHTHVQLRNLTYAHQLVLQHAFMHTSTFLQGHILRVVEARIHTYKHVLTSTHTVCLKHEYMHTSTFSQAHILCVWSTHTYIQVHSKKHTCSPALSLYENQELDQAHVHITSSSGIRREHAPRTHSKHIFVSVVFANHNTMLIHTYTRTYTHRKSRACRWRSTLVRGRWSFRKTDTGQDARAQRKLRGVHDRRQRRLI
jgi:hypothetical protein